MPGLTSSESFSQDSNISSPSLDQNNFNEDDSTLSQSEIASKTLSPYDGDVNSDSTEFTEKSDIIETSFSSELNLSQKSFNKNDHASSNLASPPTLSDNQDASSELTSPDNTSTVSKEKKGTDRRISNRVTAKPNYFDASPIVAVSSFKSISPQNKSQSFIDSDIDDDGEKTLVEKDESKFKKPTSLPKKKLSKIPLDVKVKKVNVSSKRAKVSMDSDQSSLFDIVKGGKSALASVIDDWIDNYNQSKSDAMVELLQFFVDCAGCNAQVTPSMIEEDSVMVIRHLTENFGEQAEEYPLIINRPEFKKFKAHFSLFIIQLVNLCQHNIIYDDDMIVVLVNWIVALSSSQVRAFRHTSTFAGLKLMTALIDVALRVGVEVDNTQRQLDNENQIAVAKRSREKVEKLKKRREELKQNQERLEDLMNHILNSIFVARYRDIRPEIRLLCFSEMGIWMNKYSHHFLEKNLKYLGWTLYDKVSEVRLEVLKVLHDLYKNENLVEQLILFTGRFKSRLIDMTLDIDTDVAVEAIKIVSILYKYGVLDTEECSLVEQLVFCDQRKMAHAAGEFLTLHIVQLSLEATPTKMKKGQKEEYLRQMNIKAILDFFIKTEVHDHCAYIVDSLWEHADIVKDWKTITSMLLDPNPLIELEDEEEGALIDLMCSACKQAAEGPPPGRVLNRKLSQKEKQIIDDDKMTISCHFMEHLPKFLEKYKTDVAKVTELLTIPQYFNLEVYAEKRLTKHLDGLLGHVEDVVLKNTDSQLLSTCSQTYYYLLDTDLGVKQNAEISKNKTLDCIVEKFRKSIASGIPNDEDDKGSQAYFNIVTNLKKIEAFNRHHDLSDWDLYEEINAIIDQGISGSVDEEVLLLSLSTMNMNLLMLFASMDSNNPDKDAMKLLRKRQKNFVKQSDELLQFGSIKIKTQVFNILCDFFLMFAKQILNKAPLLAQVVYEADSNLQVRMRDFIITHVFNTINDDEVLQDEEDDVKAQELHSKRSLLAGLCKLLSYGVFDIKLAAPIFGQFLRGYADFSDIIKQLMTHARENNIILFSKVLLFSLQQAFESLREDHNGKINVKSEEFHRIKDLAHRFALMLGVNTNLDNPRKSTITIHREGISYAFSNPDKETGVPANLLFLEILHEFTYRVTKIDRKAVLNHLKEVAGDMLANKSSEWMPIQTYQNGLLASINETKVIMEDDADQELEDAIALEKKTKKKSISFVDTVKKAPAPSNDKARKKLSMSKAGGTGKWLNASISEPEKEKSQKKKSKLNKSLEKKTPLKKKSIVDSNEGSLSSQTEFLSENSPKKKVTPRVAKSIPKAQKSAEKKTSGKSPHKQKLLVDYNEDSDLDFQVERVQSHDETPPVTHNSKKGGKPISNEKKFMKSLGKKTLPSEFIQESDQSPELSPNDFSEKYQNQELNKLQSPVKMSSVESNKPKETLKNKRKFSGKQRGSVASSPLRLSASGKSPAKKIKLQNSEESSSVVESEESSQEDSSSRVREDSIATPDSQKKNSKFPRKFYEMRSATPSKRARANIEDSDSANSSVTYSPRDKNTTKRQKRDISPEILNESQDLLETSS